MRRASLQVKFGLSYILVIAAVLVFMNTYPLIVSENLVVRSKQTTLQSSVSVMVTALSGLEELSEENVASAMTLVEDTGISRILVTDAAGRILYDTRETDGAVGRYGLYTEIVQALQGYDAFYADFTDGAFRSRAASPVIYRSQTIGAVYAYEYDVEQATLLLTLQKNLLRISAAVAGFVVLLSLLLSRILTRRFGVLLEAIRRVREGAYRYHAEIGGRDEISEIAEEFNSLSDRLQTTEEARRRFVSDASHELKTPLAGIRLLSDSILQTEDIDAATVREFVGDIVQETDRLTRITENLLRLTRLDSGIVEPAQSVAVAPVIERVVRMLRLVADEKRVELTYLVEREQSVRAGVDDLHQIIYNLTENAIKYNRPGGFVRVTLGGTEDECVLRVEDNGIGIPEEDMPRVFDRFYRVDKMRSRAAGGTGLGLSIVADTVRRRGGSIAVSAARAAAPASRCGFLPCGGRGRHEKKGFPVHVSRSFAAARRLCAQRRDGGRKQLYDLLPRRRAARRAGRGRHRCPHRAAPGRRHAHAGGAGAAIAGAASCRRAGCGRPRADAGRDNASEPVGPRQLGAGGLLAAVCASCGH